MDEDREQKSRERAYAIWERESRPEGRHLEHWFCAIREIAAEEAAGSEQTGTAPPEQPEGHLAGAAEDATRAPRRTRRSSR